MNTSGNSTHLYLTPCETGNQFVMPTYIISALHFERFILKYSTTTPGDGTMTSNTTGKHGDHYASLKNIPMYLYVISALLNILM